MVLQLCGALAPCQAAEEFLQSLLGSVSCHVLSLKHPGSARFLLSPEGQHLLRGLEAQFQCVFGTERLARAALDTDLGEVDMEPSPPLPSPPLFHTSVPRTSSTLAQRPGRGMCPGGTGILSQQVDPTEALQALPGRSHTLWPPDNTDGAQENMSLGRAPWGPWHILRPFLDLTLRCSAL